jgi:hypothetical protein
MARNRYAGPCKDCGETVAVGEGYFEKQRGGGWRTRHVLCTARKMVERGTPLDALSPPQRASLTDGAS